MKEQIIHQLSQLDDQIQKKQNTELSQEILGLLVEKHKLLEKLIGLAKQNAEQDPELLSYLTKSLQENKAMLAHYYQQREHYSSLLNNYQALKRYLDQAHND